MNDLDARFSRAINDLDRFLGPAFPQHTSVFRRRERRRRLMTGGAAAVVLATCVTGLVVLREARQDSLPPAATDTTPDPDVGPGLLTAENGQPVVLTVTYGRIGIEGSLVQQDQCWWFERRNSPTRAAVIFPAGSTSADDVVSLPDGTRAADGDEFTLQGPLAQWSHVADMPDAASARLSACLGREPASSDLLAIYSAADYEVVAPAPSTAPPTATSRPAPITTPPATSAPVGTTATVAPTEPVPAERVHVRDVLTSVDVPAPAVLYQAPRDALGFEDCVECDPVTPWAPTVTADGLVVVADELHREWLVIDTSGATSTTPYPDGFRAVSPPIVGPDGRIYVVDGNFDDDDAQLLIFDVAALQNAVGAVPIMRRVSSQLWFDGRDLIVNGQVLDVGLDTAAAEARPTIEWDLSGPTEVTVTWEGVRRTWVFEPGQGVGAGAVPAGLTDGSVLITVVGTSEVLLLRPDGAALRFSLPGTAGYNGSRWVSHGSIVQLEVDGDEAYIRRYELPTGA